MICSPQLECARRDFAVHTEWEPTRNKCSKLDEPVGIDELTDEQLMTAVALQADPEAFTVLFRRWHSRLVAYFRRRVSDTHSADDLASDVFLRVLEIRAKYRAEVAFRAWFWRIAKYKLLQFWESARRRMQWAAEGDASVYVCSREPACDAQLIANEVRGSVQSLVCQLPMAQFEVLHKRYWEGAGMAEIADGEGISAQAVSQRLLKCHAILREDAAVRNLVGEQITLQEVGLE